MKTNNPNPNIVTVDAAGRALGRVASEAAVLLRGKDQPSFARHLSSATRVKIINAGQLKMTARKLTGEKHLRYTGYPAGLRSLSLAQLIARKGIAEPLRLAVYGMLPANKLRAPAMKRLTIIE